MRDIEKATGKTPPSLLTQPKLKPENLPVWDFYRRVSRSGQASELGPQPISLSEVRSLCSMYGWNSPEFQLYILDLVQDLDETYFEHRAAKSAASETGKRPGKGR